MDAVHQIKVLIINAVCKWMMHLDEAYLICLEDDLKRAPARWEGNTKKGGKENNRARTYIPTFPFLPIYMKKEVSQNCVVKITLSGAGSHGKFPPV